MQACQFCTRQAVQAAASRLAGTTGAAGFASRIVRAFPARSPTHMQSSYKEGAVNRSERERTISSVLHVDFDIGPVRVVPALP
jgi:hypothetical protein